MRVLAGSQRGGLVLSEQVRWAYEFGKRRYVFRILGQEEKPILLAPQVANSGSLATRNCDLDLARAFF